jgi:hypothetical protein
MLLLLYLVWGEAWDGKGIEERYNQRSFKNHRWPQGLGFHLSCNVAPEHVLVRRIHRSVTTG